MLIEEEALYNTVEDFRKPDQTCSLSKYGRLIQAEQTIDENYDGKRLKWNKRRSDAK